MRRSLDAALVSPGNRTPFPSLDPASVDMAQGTSFCLANNVWGTNCAACFLHQCLLRHGVRGAQAAVSSCVDCNLCHRADVMWTPYGTQPPSMRFRFEIKALETWAPSAAGVAAPPREISRSLGLFQPGTAAEVAPAPQAASAG